MEGRFGEGVEKIKQAKRRRKREIKGRVKWVFKFESDDVVGIDS